MAARGTAAGLFGVIASLPALRLGGAYLAMVSIAFNVVVEQVLVHGPDVMGGAMGIPGIPPIEFAGWQFDDGATSATIMVTALIAASSPPIAQRRCAVPNEDLP
jgi:branched-chain amino acid transport system permease protein